MEDNNSSVHLMLTSKGRYYWAIRFGFNMEKVTNQQVLERLTDMDKLLTDKFPKNAKEFFGGSSRTQNIDMFEE